MCVRQSGERHHFFVCVGFSSNGERGIEREVYICINRKSGKKNAGLNLI